jgi:hypothetical protein
MLSDKWVSVDAIIERASRTFPDIEIPRANAAEWCFDVVKELGVFPAFEEKTGTIEVKNNQAILPCDVYRVLHTWPGGVTATNSYTSAFRQGWAVENEGRTIDVSSHSMYGTPTTVNIQYLAFVVDEFGYPMIFTEAAEAAMWYLIMKMKTADFINETMSPDKFAYLQSQYETELGYARSKTMRWTTREELDTIVRVARSVVRPAHYAAR